MAVVKKDWARQTRLESAGRRQVVYDIIHGLHELRMKELEEAAQLQKIDTGELKQILCELTVKGLVYSPKRGMVGCVDE